jgi:hypothetical protein
VGVALYVYNPSYLKGRGRRIVNLKPALANSVRPYLKNKIQNKRAECVAHVPAWHM